jgi:hypothetical protein
LRIARASLSRLSSAYEPSVRAIELLVEGMSFELDDGEALAIPGERLLVDHLTEHDGSSSRARRHNALEW